MAASLTQISMSNAPCTMRRLRRCCKSPKTHFLRCVGHPTSFISSSHILNPSAHLGTFPSSFPSTLSHRVFPSPVEGTSMPVTRPTRAPVLTSSESGMEGKDNAETAHKNRFVPSIILQYFLCSTYSSTTRQRFANSGISSAPALDNSCVGDTPYPCPYYFPFHLSLHSVTMLSINKCNGLVKYHEGR
jgi:hypothetical protein